MRNNSPELELSIKNMVCPRCIAAVDQVLQSVNAEPVYVRLGEVLLDKPLTSEQQEVLSARLKHAGFELLDDSRKQLIEKVKAAVIDHIHHKEDEKFDFVQVLTQHLHKEYSVISKLFSETEGVTIEQYVILQKIEKAKELLAYNQMTLSEIAFKLGYSSVAHLSTQFKKVTGLTPSQFKTQGNTLRRSLDEI